MKTIEQTGRTTEEAIELALKKLGVTKDKVRIEIIDEGSKGLFGLLGAKAAKVKVVLLDEEPEKTQGLKQTDKNLSERILKKLLDLMGVKVNVSRRIKDGNLILVIRGKDAGVLIGKHGITLNALQYIVNLIIFKQEASTGKVIIDVENYRRRREDVLKRLAQRLASKVSATRRRYVLEPMNPYERHIIHSTLQNYRWVETESIGEGDGRRVVIKPKDLKLTKGRLCKDKK
jgi:spoIIIJ-associated protein